MNSKIAADISRLVWDKLSTMIDEDKSIIETIGCNGISDVVLNVVLNYKEEISEEFEKYADFASDNFWSDEMETFDGNPLEEEIYYVCQRCYHTGLKDGYRYRKSKEE